MSNDTRHQSGDRDGGSHPSESTSRLGSKHDAKRSKLELRKLRLEARKLEAELRAFRWPGWWELGKLGVSVLAVVSIGLGILEYRAQRLDRAIDLLFQHPDQGAFILARRGEEGYEALLAAIAGEVKAPAATGRPVSLATLRQLRALGGDELESLLPRLTQHFADLELPRTQELVQQHRLVDRPPRNQPAPSLGVIQDLRTALCAQYEVDLSFAAMLADRPEARAALDHWKQVREQTSFFEENCRWSTGSAGSS
jgi:hypothetical protein